MLGVVKLARSETAYFSNAQTDVFSDFNNTEKCRNVSVDCSIDLVP